MKTNIGVGSVVKSNFRELEERTMEEIIRRIMKEVVGCVQYMLEKKKLVFQL